MKYIAIILSTTVLFATLISCNNSQKKSNKKPQIGIEQEIEPDFETIVNKWNDAHNDSDIEIFADLYYDEVVFYTAILSNEDCTKKKELQLNKFTDFHQTIGEITINQINNLQYKCSFIKTSYFEGKSHEYPAYLIFSQKDSVWKISTEGDLITDENIANISTPDNAVAGDFNADGAPEYMWLVAPNLPEETNNNSFGECEGDCTCYIQFSNPNIPSIKLENCIGGHPVNEGDLNDDGYDEIGILPEWWTSYWHAYKVFTYRNGIWENFVDPIDTHYSQWEQGIDVISKDPNKPGHVIINYSEMLEVDIVVLTKSVKIS